MVVELLWCWLCIGKGISNPNLWKGNYRAMGSHTATGAIWASTLELPFAQLHHKHKGKEVHSMSQYIFPA